MVKTTATKRPAIVGIGSAATLFGVTTLQQARPTEGEQDAFLQGICTWATAVWSITVVRWKITLHEVPQPFGHGQHPLTHWQAGNTWCAAVSTMRRVLRERQTPWPLQE